MELSSHLHTNPKSTRKSLAIASAFLLLAILAGVVGLRHREPSYNGKPLSFWLKGFELDDFPGKPSFNESNEAVFQIGTNAFPTLFRLLRTKDSDFKQRIARLARTQHFMKVHYVAADGQRWAARQGFLALGKVAKYAVPELERIDQEEIARGEKHRYTAEILGWIKQYWLKQEDNLTGSEILKDREKGGPLLPTGKAVK